MAYLVEAEANSVVLNAVLQIVNKLLEILYIGNLQDLGVINVGLGGLLKIQLLADGKTLGVTLLGLEISVALNRADPNEGGDDVAIITIGDSTVKLPCSPDGVKDNSNLQINLIKANRTKITESSIQEFHTDMMCMEEMQSSIEMDRVRRESPEDLLDWIRKAM